MLYFKRLMCSDAAAHALTGLHTLLVTVFYFLFPCPFVDQSYIVTEILGSARCFNSLFSILFRFSFYFELVETHGILWGVLKWKQYNMVVSCRGFGVEGWAGFPVPPAC